MVFQWTLSLRLEYKLRCSTRAENSSECLAWFWRIVSPRRVEARILPPFTLPPARAYYHWHFLRSRTPTPTSHAVDEAAFRIPRRFYGSSRGSCSSSKRGPGVAVYRRRLRLSPRTAESPRNAVCTRVHAMHGYIRVYARLDGFADPCLAESFMSGIDNRFGRASIFLLRSHLACAGLQDINLAATILTRTVRKYLQTTAVKNLIFIRRIHSIAGMFSNWTTQLSDFFKYRNLFEIFELIKQIYFDFTPIPFDIRRKK